MKKKISEAMTFAENTLHIICSGILCSAIATFMLSMMNLI